MMLGEAMQPTLHVAPPAPAPPGHWLARGLVALLLERRLPYQIARLRDRLCNLVGLRHKTIRANGFAVTVRRLTCDELFVQNILVNRDYTPPGYEIRETDTVVDVGGNIGTFALLAARRAAHGRVLTFEPNSENYQLLLRNIRNNGFENVVPVRAALSGSKGAIKLFTAAQGGYHSVLAERTDSPECYELVDSVRLEDVFAEHHLERINFLKLDCEGAEYDILYGLPRPYFARIDRIAMEYHGDQDHAKRRAQASALVAHLEKVGFRIDAFLDFAGFRCGFIRATRSA